MAIRNIRVEGDEVLSKISKEVKEITPKIAELIEDMIDTMYEANGVGLAAVQVGVLKRLVVIDVSEEGNEPMVLINPVITKEKGEQIGPEGCLSVPGKSGTVKRPMYVECVAYDENMKKRTIKGEGLLARAICHECAHLDGHLYTELVIGEVMDDEQYEEMHGEEE